MSDSAYYRLGRFAGAKFRKARWMWRSATGSEAEAIRAEYGVGREMAAAVLEQAAGTRDPEIRTLVDDTGGLLAARVRNPLHRFQFTVLQDDHRTAFALPGGFIFVARTLVDLCGRDRDEIAFVLAHEMAHVIRRHAIDRLLTQKVLSATSMVLPGRMAMGTWLRQVGLQWLERAYSREQEFEADALGVRLARAAGFNPACSIRLLGRLKDLDPASGPLGLGPYFSTHPPVAERVERLQRYLEE